MSPFVARPPLAPTTRVLARLALTAAVFGCGGSGAGERGIVDPAGAGARAVTVGFAAVANGRADGRIERGDSVRVVVTRGTDTLAVDSLTVSPASAAEVAPGGWLRVRQAGALAVTATLRGAASAPPATSVGVLAVAEPPTLVFDLLQGGNRDVWRVALDGRGLARLTTDPADDQHPTAAGGTVVFTSYRGGRAQLFAIALDGTGERQITATTDNLVEPALSADGRRLAYVRDTAGTRRLWWSGADGSAPTPAAAAAWPGAVDGAPAWAPDGGRVAFMSTRGGDAGVFLVAPAAPNAAAPDPAAALGASPDRASATVEPAWSPDGRRLVVTSTRAGAGELFSVDLATGTATQLTRADGTVGQAAWLPDGRVVFTAFSRAGSRLCWLDPRAPDLVHDIPTGPGSAAHPAVVR